MKLSNAVVGLQVFTKEGYGRDSITSVRGKVGIIERLSQDIGSYELAVKFPSGWSDVMNACDVRKAKVTDAGAVVKVLRDSSSKHLTGKIRTVCKPAGDVSVAITMQGSDGWGDSSIGQGTYWHVYIEDVSLVNTVSDFMSAPKA